ncbi:MAG TPA: tetratricopeptide repeat protein [Pyrinomonadaceae bacterium]|nr:tetratricopeptide repeat protein [Pyrinomonadaceae bacterium]
MRFTGKYVLSFFALVIFFQSGVSAQLSPENLSPAETIKNFQARPTAENLVAARKIGFALLGENKFNESELVFSEILTNFPADGLSLYGKAVGLFNLKQYSEAENTATKASAIFEKQKNNAALADVLVLSAVISAVTGKNPAAIEKLKKAVVLAPTHFDANLSLARAFFGNGDLAASIAAFRVALRQQPRNVKANFFLASALERNGETADALNIYRELIKIAPGFAEGYLGLGVLLVKTEGANSSEGLNSLQKAVEINPNLYEAQITLGKTLLRQNKTEQALIYLQKAVELLPGNPEPHYQLLQAFRKLGRKADADAEQAIIKKIHENRRGSSSAPSQ